MKNLYHLSLLVFFLLFLSLFVLCVTNLLNIENRTNESHEVQNEVGIENYKYFEKDYHKKTTKFGMVSLPSLEDEYLSYDDYSVGKSVLISSFESDEFECYGSCYCSEERRTSKGKVLVEGVSYLVAAASSVLAMNMAKDFFSEKCDEEFSSFCESNSIESDVEDCGVIYLDGYDPKKDNYYKREGEDFETRTYLCYGNCIRNKKFGPPPQHEMYLREGDIKCKKFKKEAELTIQSNDIIFAKYKRTPLSKKMRQTAKKRFSDLHLMEYCKKNSMLEFEYHRIMFRQLEGGALGAEERYTQIIKRIQNRCVGRRNDYEFDNVHCRQIDPRPRGISVAYWDKKWWEDKKKWDAY